MQLVGRTCSLTGQKIQLDAAGIGCITCDVVYLRSAIGGSECPQCQQDMNAQAEQASLQQKNQTEIFSSKGRNGFTTVGAIVLAQFIVNMIGSFVAAIMGIGHSGVFSILAGLFLWTVARGGNKLARILLIVSIASSAAIEGFVALKPAQSEHYSSAGLLLSLAVANLVALCLLFTRSVNAYLDDQRHPGQD
ncbi:MAG: hypothetical protein JWR15_1809 [Prosthecobacter sp.]|nr:hypothetical protein [Prosthecobacter sp.]